MVDAELGDVVDAELDDLTKIINVKSKTRVTPPQKKRQLTLAKKTKHKMIFAQYQTYISLIKHPTVFHFPFIIIP